MIIGIDIGASKTLVGLFSSVTTMDYSQKFSTPPEPDELIRQIVSTIKSIAGHSAIQAIGVAAPGQITKGAVTRSGKLVWHNLELQKMLSDKLGLPIFLENDAVLGGLAESRIGNGVNCTNLLYITISTGVGTGIILDSNIPKNIKGSEAGQMIINQEGNIVRLEQLISGAAFKKIYGKFGYEVEDAKIWKQYASDTAYGLYNISTLIQPETIVIGGGMSLHFQRFIAPLKEKMNSIHNDLFELPKIVQAKYPETAVVYGCNILARDNIANE